MSGAVSAVLGKDVSAGDVGTSKIDGATGPYLIILIFEPEIFLWLLQNCCFESSQSTFSNIVFFRY